MLQIPPTHLQRVQVQGFKSIKTLDLALHPINILIGANGSGKSNFISLFTFLRHLSEGKLQIYVERNGFANVFFHFGSKHTERIALALRVGNRNYGVEFVHGQANDALVFDSEYCTDTELDKPIYIKGQLGESGLLSTLTDQKEVLRAQTQHYLQGCRVYHFHDTSATAAFKQAQKCSANSYLYPDAANLAPYLLYLRQHYPASYKEIVTAIQTVAPFFHDFYLQPQGPVGDESLLLRWIHREHDTPFSAHQLSDGTARFICMATLFLQPAELRPNTLVLDEPELGLHPAALEVLAEIIKAVSKQTQVICSTQSITFANHFEAEDFIVVDQQQGSSVFSRLDADSLNEWLDEYGVGDIWNKNLIGGRPEW